MPFSATTGESRISNNNSERIIENSKIFDVKFEKDDFKLLNSLNEDQKAAFRNNIYIQTSFCSFFASSTLKHAPILGNLIQT